MIGVFSLLERVLLASIQYRQGPITIMLNGFAQLIADGIKIYSKYSLDVLSWGSGLILLGTSFTVLVGLCMLIYSSSFLSCLTNDFDLLIYICLSGLLGIFCLIPTVLTTNRYVSIGCIRQLRAMIIADIGIETFIVVMLLFFISLNIFNDHLMFRIFSISIYIVLFIPIFILVLIISARAPFDLPEAESELIAGTLTDLGGTSFSFCLLLDYLELLTWSTIFSILITSLLFSNILVLIFILISYVGRLILVRILLTDVPKLLFLVIL
jgi:NADH-quinone oxidoreductase subunit H